MTWRLADVVAATGAEVLRPGDRVAFPAIATDTRALPEGALFVALRGERFDAHRFLADAVGGGAAGVLVDDAEAVRADLPDAVTALAVPDTLRALQDLAVARRRAVAPCVLGITGSNGKTTTKEMLAAVLEAAGIGGVLKTRGNLNNLIGLPLTLLELAAERFAVVEMGMNVPGEIWRLTEIADPDVGVITNVGPVHLAGVGGTEDGVARAKGELFARMRRDAVAIANADDRRVAALADAFPGRVVRFGAAGDVRAEAVACAPGGAARFLLRLDGGEVEVALRIPGRHHVANALAAAAAAHAVGVGLDAIATGLGRAESVGARMKVRLLPSGVTLLDDSYNANPVSTAAALRSLAEAPARRRMAVLGDMLELGDASAVHHHAVGRLAAELRLDVLWLYGPHAEAAAAGAAGAGTATVVHVAATHAEIAAALARDAGPGDWILVKGSRGQRMEEVVRLLGTHA